MQGFQPQKAKKPSTTTSADKPVGGFLPKSQRPEQVQALNQAPDTELGMFKPGEYVLPVDTVHALGGPDKLDAVVAQTHTPAPEHAVVPEGAEPQFFFSNGGRVPTDEEKQRLATAPASMHRRENTTFEQPAPAATPRPARDPGLANTAMGLPQDTAPQFHSYAAQGQKAARMPEPAPLSAPTQPTAAELGVVAPTSPSNTFPGNRLHGASGFSGAPIRSADALPARLPGERNPQVTQAAMQSPLDGDPSMFSTPQMRASLSVPKPAAPAVPQPDNMAGMAATGFHPNINAKAERAPAGVPTAPAAAAPKNTAGVSMGTANSPTAMYFDDGAKEIAQRWNSGDAAGAVGAGARTALGTVGMAGIEALDKTFSPVVDAGSRFVGGFLGSNATAAPAPAQQTATTTQQPTPTTATQPAAATAPTAPAAATATTANAAGGQASTAQPAAAAPQSDLPAGVYSHGRGQYSDSPAGMGFTPGFTGQPSAQSLQAASNLSNRGQRDSAARVLAGPAPQAAGFRAPTVNTSRNDFTTRENLRRARMDATSLIHRSHWANEGSGEAAAQRYAQLQAADLAAQGQQNQMDMQAMGFNAGMTREQVQQDGANQRALLGNARDAARLRIEERRLAGEEQTRGFQVRQGLRLEQAQNAYLSAKTPEEQATALATLRALSGKSDGQLKDNYMSLGGGQEWDAQAGTMRNVPQRLIDLRTGQEVGGQPKASAPPVPSAASERVVGQVYTAPNGQQVRWAGKGWEPVK